MSSLCIIYIKYIDKYSNINIKNINTPVGMQTCCIVEAFSVITFFQIVYITVYSVSMDLILCA